MDELKCVKSALHYRNCMVNIANAIIKGTIRGIPGTLDISCVDFSELQGAITQAEILDKSDAATRCKINMYIYMYYLCS